MLRFLIKGSIFEFIKFVLSKHTVFLTILKYYTRVRYASHVNDTQTIPTIFAIL